jgi:hypothetical protein
MKNMDPSRLRPVQNATSMGILETTLKAIVISATVAAFLMDSRRVIAKSPRSYCRGGELGFQTQPC